MIRMVIHPARYYRLALAAVECVEAQRKMGVALYRLSVALDGCNGERTSASEATDMMVRLRCGGLGLREVR